MPTPIEAYRQGYEKGRSDSAGGRLAEISMGMLRDDPGGHFQKGYSDGAAGKPFSPPSIPAPSRRRPNELIPKFSENPMGWFLGVLIVIELWTLWQLIKAPFQLIASLMRSEKPSPWVIVKNIILAGAAIALVWWVPRANEMRGPVMTPGPTSQPQSASLPQSEALPLVARPKGSASVALVDEMAKAIPAVATCLANSTSEQVLAALDIQRLDIIAGRDAILVSGAGRDPCSLFGARMPLQWIYEKVDTGYRQILDVGAVDSVSLLPQQHSGYKDLRLSSAISAGTAAYMETYIFDGAQYRRSGDGREVPIQGDSGSPVQQPQATSAPPPSAPAATPSFNCAAATTPVETLICRDGDLGVLERSMADTYRSVLQTLPEQQRPPFRREHLDWFKTYARTCNALTDAELRACVVRFLSDHTRELQTRLR
jgi:uncharacterized protein YecT (DUF1311 family)